MLAMQARVVHALQSGAVQAEPVQAMQSPALQAAQD
jgi:hypothetical protein